MIVLVPFLGVLVGLYGGLLFMIGPSEMDASLSEVAVHIVDLPSVKANAPNAAAPHPWSLTIGDLFVTTGLIFLSLELVKATNTKGWSLGNHGLSLLTLVACVLLLVLVPGFATTTFFFLTLMVFVDVSVGVMVTTNSAKRDIGIGGIGG